MSANAQRMAERLHAFSEELAEQARKAHEAREARRLTDESSAIAGLARELYSMLSLDKGRAA